MAKKAPTAAAWVYPPGEVPSGVLSEQLAEYRVTKKVSSKGKIAALIYASRLARSTGLPFDVDRGITTDGEGQVRGLGKGSVQAVLADYGVERVLAEEGGRTSRGSLGNIRAYLGFLNELANAGQLDLSAVEAWWVDQAKQFFSAKPFALRLEQGKSLRFVVRDLLAQAQQRQDEGGGTMFVGAMLQHLIGAKLELVLPDVGISHNGYSVADAPGGRAGDFEIGGSVLHVTVAPGEAVIRKCQDNLAAGLQPIIVTVHKMIAAADVFAEQKGIADTLDVLDAEQFLVANLHELGGFQVNQRRVSVEALVDKYNSIVDANETDPSLRISKG
jgi:hypothetical protein